MKRTFWTNVVSLDKFRREVYFSVRDGGVRDL